jgi:hypothetical protein
MGKYISQAGRRSSFREPSPKELVEQSPDLRAALEEIRALEEQITREAESTPLVLPWHEKSE